MSQDRFTEVTHQSWFSRIGGAIKGVVIGLILIIVSFPLLFLNEGRAVKRAKTLKEGSGAVVSVTTDTVDNTNSGKLIHISGKADTDAILADADFNISSNALKFRRVVEMYQWRENKRTDTDKKIGGGTETTTTYDYEKVWSSELIDSSSFHRAGDYSNPASMAVQGKEWTAEDVHLGSFKLTNALLSMINSYQALGVASDAPLPASVQGKGSILNGGYYLGADPTKPGIGDLKIRFETIKPCEVSVIGKQVQNTLESYTAEAGGSILLLEEGTHSAQEMFATAEKSNAMMTWILRLVGFVLMFIGFAMVFNPLSVFADVLPFLGSIVGAGTGLVAGLLAASLSLLTISVAWIVYRPILGCLILAISIAVAVFMRGKLKKTAPAH